MRPVQSQGMCHFPTDVFFFFFFLFSFFIVLFLFWVGDWRLSPTQSGAVAAALWAANPKGPSDICSCWVCWSDFDDQMKKTLNMTQIGTCPYFFTFVFWMKCSKTHSQKSPNDELICNLLKCFKRCLFTGTRWLVLHNGTRLTADLVLVLRPTCGASTA